MTLEKIVFSEKVFFFAVLVCASHKKPVVVLDFDLLCLEDYFEFFKSEKTTSSLVNTQLKN